MRDMDLGGARAPAPAVTVAAVPAALGARLAPYQRDGVAWILGHLCGRGARSCILADAPGLGKTVQAIAAVAALVARGAARRVLVVAPAGVVGVWEAEFARFAGNIRERPWSTAFWREQWRLWTALRESRGATARGRRRRAAAR